MKVSRFLLPAAALVFGTVAVSGQNSLRIEISSSWTGLGSAPEMQMMVTDTGGRFIANGKSVDPKAVNELLDAMEASPVESPSLEECGADQNWLEANYAPALRGITHRKMNILSKEQIELFHSQFTSRDSSQTSFEGLMKSWHTDDYPKLSVTIYAHDRQFGVTSISQGPFMLPWAGVDKPRGGYSCRISRAIYALLPKGFTNRDRLSLGEDFRWELAERTLDEIRSEWDVLDANHLVGADIAPILDRYTVVKSAVSNLSSIDLDGTEAWNAELQSKELPPNLILGVSLAYRKRQLEGVSSFLERAPKYTALVLSVPWLHAYLHDNSQSRLELRFVDGRSLSPKAASDLAQDLRTHGKPELAQRVEKDAADSAFIEVNSHDRCWARALVFPNRQVLLWHFQCGEVFAFKESQFHTWEFYGWRSTGSMIEEDGSLQR